MIPVTCVCGKSREVAAMFAGRQVKCPDCGAMVAVPAAQAVAGDRLAPVPPAAEPSPVEQMTRDRFAVAKSSSRALCRHLPFTSLSGIGLIVAFFCLPWLRTSCGTMITAEPTGYNLATNTVDSGVRELQEKAKETQESASKVAGQSYADAMASAMKAEEIENPPWGRKSPELWIFPGLGLALVAWGLFRTVVPSYGVARETLVALMAVMAAGGLLVYERAKWYRKPPLQDMKADAERLMRKQLAGTPVSSSVSADMESMQQSLLDLIQVKNQPGFWLTVVSLAGAAVTMLGWLLFRGSGEA